MLSYMTLFVRYALLGSRSVFGKFVFFVINTTEEISRYHVEGSELMSRIYGSPSYSFGHRLSLAGSDRYH